MLGSSGAAASSYGAAWHLPRAPARELGAPLGERLALSGQRGRAWARRRRLERPKEAHFLSIFRSSESLLSGEVAQDENFPFLLGFASLEARGISMKPVFFLMQIGPGSPRKPGQWAPGVLAGFTGHTGAEGDLSTVCTGPCRGCCPACHTPQPGLTVGPTRPCQRSHLLAHLPGPAQTQTAEEGPLLPPSRSPAWGKERHSHPEG